MTTTHDTASQFLMVSIGYGGSIRSSVRQETAPLVAENRLLAACGVRDLFVVRLRGGLWRIRNGQAPSGPAKAGTTNSE